MNHHILVVEDEPATRTMLTRMLETAGFRTSIAGTAAEARGAVAADPPDLVILDLNLPDEKDLGLARDLCGRAEFATIIVTARAEDLDRVAGLELGADDYIAKPFFPREVVARINVILRRLNGVVARAAETAGTLRFDGWKLDLNAHSLTNPLGRPVPLTRAEFSLLAALVVRPGKP